MLPMFIGQLVESYRATHKLSLRKLAARIGVGPTILYHFEKGRGLSDKNWCKIFLWLLQQEDITPK